MENLKIEIEGIFDYRILQKYDSNHFFDQYKNNNRYLVLLCLYSEVDISLGQEFTYIINVSKKETIACKTKLLMVTEWGFKLDCLPLGHKTVCVMEVLDKDINIDFLPVVEDYGISDDKIFLSVNAFDYGLS